MKLRIFCNLKDTKHQKCLNQRHFLRERNVFGEHCQCLHDTECIDIED